MGTYFKRFGQKLLMILDRHKGDLFSLIIIGIMEEWSDGILSLKGPKEDKKEVLNFAVILHIIPVFQHPIIPS
jgi:hypothetical protein